MQGFRSIVQKYPFVDTNLLSFYDQEDSGVNNTVSPEQVVDHTGAPNPERRLPLHENQKPQPKQNQSAQVPLSFCIHVQVPPKPQLVPNTNNPVNNNVYTNNAKYGPRYIPVYPGYLQSANSIPLSTQRGTLNSQPNRQGRCIARPVLNQQKVAGNAPMRGAAMYCDRNGSIVFENCNVTIQRVYSESSTGHARMHICGLNVTPKESEKTILSEQKYDSVIKKLDSLLERIHQQKRQQHDN